MIKNNIKNKVFILVLLIILIGIMNVNKVYADTIPQIEIENKIETNAVNRGQIFQVKVNLTNNIGLISLKIALDYDQTIFKLIDFEKGTCLSTLTLTTTNINTSQGYGVLPFNFLWDGKESDSSNGNLLILTFESSIQTEPGMYSIGFTYDQNNTKSEYSVSQEISISGGNIEIIKAEYSVIYKNYDSTILYEKDYNENELPEYIGDTPVRETDEKYSYVFNNWKNVLSDNKQIIIYEATYIKTPIQYQVFLYADGDIIDAFFCDYGSYPSLSNPPVKKNYTFIGWYKDEQYKEKYTLAIMETNDLKLYGYYQYNIRENDIPQIKLEVQEVINNEVSVNVNIKKNTGIASLILTLEYDMSGLEFVDFEKGTIFNNAQFDFTNKENISSIEDYHFYWEAIQNNFDTGLLLTLKFKIKEDCKNGKYYINLKYNEKTDATFRNELNELWYTKLDIYNTYIPVGEIFSWHEEINNQKDIIDVISNVGMSVDIELEFILNTNEIDITDEEINNIAGENMKLISAYEINLLKNNEKVEVISELTIRIKLTREQKNSKKLELYYLDDQGKMTFHDSWIEDDEIVFVTDHLSEWLIIGDINNLFTNSSIIMIVLFIMLICVLCSYILILLSKYRKNSLYKKIS